MIARSERRSPPQWAGSGLSWQAEDRVGTYISRKLRTIAFWLTGDFRLPTQWAVQPGPPELLVGIAEAPEIEPRDAFIFVWQPSGFLAEVGRVRHPVAHSIADELAQAIGGRVADGRTEW